MFYKIMQVMVNSEETRKLVGRIEMDQIYLGGKYRGGSNDHSA